MEWDNLIKDLNSAQENDGIFFTKQFQKLWELRKAEREDMKNASSKDELQKNEQEMNKNTEIDRDKENFENFDRKNLQGAVAENSRDGVQWNHGGHQWR